MGLELTVNTGSASKRMCGPHDLSKRFKFRGKRLTLGFPDAVQTLPLRD